LIELKISYKGFENMAGKANVLKTMHDLTPKQRKFVDIYVSEYGLISKTEAAKRAGYVAKDPHTIASARGSDAR
jgi:translation initiation factor 2B subunit (eIF-2B alpha/beta/delta family)